MTSTTMDNLSVSLMHGCFQSSEQRFTQNTYVYSRVGVLTISSIPWNGGI